MSPELIETFASHPWLSVVTTAGVSTLVCLVLRWILLTLMTRWNKAGTSAGIIGRNVRTTLGPVMISAAWLFVSEGADDGLVGIATARKFTSLLFILSFSILAAQLVKGFGEAVIASHPYDTDDNYRARGILTQTRVLTRTLSSVIVVVGIAAGLMVFPSVRQLGTGLLASAGIVGVAAGLAAKPILGNFLAGLQLAFTQPIRIDDVVVIENEWGRIEEIHRFYVVVKIWDERRMVVPLQYFIETPFQNWTRGSASLLGTVFLWLDYRAPIEPLRKELTRVCTLDKDWDQRVAIIQVTDANERGIQIRALVSSVNSSRNFDLRCRVREQLLDFINQHYPESLIITRAEITT